jgi:TPR repeat protein
MSLAATASGCLVGVDLSKGTPPPLAMPEIPAGIYALDVKGEASFERVDLRADGRYSVAEYEKRSGRFEPFATILPVLRMADGETLAFASVLDRKSGEPESFGSLLFIRPANGAFELAFGDLRPDVAQRLRSAGQLDVDGLALKMDDRRVTIGGALTTLTLPRLTRPPVIKQSDTSLNVRVRAPALCTSVVRTAEQTERENAEVSRLRGEIDAGRASAAMPALERLAGTCHLRAAYVLAEAYGRGDGVPRNANKARELFMIVAARGNDGAHLALATAFASDEYGVKDLDAADGFFQASVRNGRADAQYEYAEYLANTPGDDQKTIARRLSATGWYEKAAAQGHRLAMVSLAFVRWRDGDPASADALLKQATSGNPPDDVVRKAQSISRTIESSRQLKANLDRMHREAEAERARLKSELANMEAHAWRLPPPDSRLLFEDNNRWLDQNGNAIPPALAARAMPPEQYWLQSGVAELTAASNPQLYQKKLFVQQGLGPNYSGVYNLALAQPMADLLMNVAQRAAPLREVVEDEAAELRACEARARTKNISGPQFVCLQASGDRLVERWRCSSRAGEADALRCIFESNIVTYAAGRQIGWDVAAAVQRLATFRAERRENGLLFVLQRPR